jgi:serine/threonine protein kinase
MVELHPDLLALIGSVIHDHYRVDALLGQGGMGAVFRGRHLGLQRDVAIKVLRPELGRTDSTAKRFDREAHSASRLDHPNCVRVFDFGTTASGVKYLVMELLAGAELEASLGQPWPPARAVDTIVQIFEGLEHAHHFGIVHRDLKPENVFVTHDFRGREIVKLVDFGIAKLIDGDSEREQLTRAGMVFGTPRYMSPEQATGGKLDERTDLYAAGLILYEMLSGHPPFAAEEASILLRMHILAPPPALPASVPEPLATVVYKLLEKSRNDRYASAREVIDALARVRPQLEHASAAVVVPVLSSTSPIATPSMATHLEAGASAGWDAAAPPGASVGIAAASLPLPPPPPPPPPPPLAAPPPPPNAATGMQPVNNPSVAITSVGPAVTTSRPVGPARPWLPWAIAAGAIFLALMAFGAGQALQEDTASGDESATAALDPFASYDRECSDQAECELSCAKDCTARCSNVSQCEVSVGPGSRVVCDDVDQCEVRCAGDCVVECPSGNCVVECPHPGDKDDKGKKPKKTKHAKRCGDTYVCGQECD